MTRISDLRYFERRAAQERAAAEAAADSAVRAIHLEIADRHEEQIKAFWTRKSDRKSVPPLAAARFNRSDREEPATVLGSLRF